MYELDASTAHEPYDTAGGNLLPYYNLGCSVLEAATDLGEHACAGAARLRRGTESDL